VGELDAKRHWSRGLDGTDYLTGAVGLNNLKATDYVNVVLQARHATPHRTLNPEP
jgi:U4/U6.U5 tri-snRNP-associated protein 2